MLMLKLDPSNPSNPSDRVHGNRRFEADANGEPSFRIFRNGVLHHVVDGPENRVRNQVIGLANLHPEDSWDYAPTA